MCLKGDSSEWPPDVVQPGKHVSITSGLYIFLIYQDNFTSLSTVCSCLVLCIILICVSSAHYSLLRTHLPEDAKDGVKMSKRINKLNFLSFATKISDNLDKF